MHLLSLFGQIFVLRGSTTPKAACFQLASSLLLYPFHAQPCQYADAQIPGILHVYRAELAPGYGFRQRAVRYAPLNLRRGGAYFVDSRQHLRSVMSWTYHGVMDNIDGHMDTCVIHGR